MLPIKILDPTQKKWADPCVSESKNDEALRFCVDYWISIPSSSWIHTNFQESTKISAGFEMIEYFWGSVPTQNPDKLKYTKKIEMKHVQSRSMYFTDSSVSCSS